MSRKIPYWIQNFRSQDLLEETYERQTPRRLLELISRGFVWSLCTRFSALSDGVMGQACTLLERVIAKEYKLYASVPRRCSEWRQIEKKLIARTPLLASVCIALVTKMLSAAVPFDSMTIQQELAKNNHHYTLAQINAAELEAYQKLDFHIPLFTNVQKATYMATNAGMTGVFLEGVMLITEVMDYYRGDIQRQVWAVAVPVSDDRPTQSRDMSNIRDLHLAAGCVIAAGLFLRFSGVDPLPQLCYLAQCSKAYLKCVGDVIHQLLHNECTAQENAVQQTATQHQPANNRPAKRRLTIPPPGTRQLPARMCKQRRV